MPHVDHFPRPGESDPYGGLVATDHRASLSGEKLDQILFLRENALMANFDLGWL